MDVSRRDFLKAASAVSLGFEGFRAFLDKAEAAPAAPGIGFGPLVADAAGQQIVCDPADRLVDVQSSLAFG